MALEIKKKNPEEKNPYADANGNPKPGMLPAFVQWAEEKEKERLKSLPKKEREKEEKELKRFHNKMQSGF